MDAFSTTFQQNPEDYNVTYRDGNPMHVQFDNLVLAKKGNPLALYNSEMPEKCDLRKAKDFNIYVGKNGSMWRKVHGKFVVAKGVIVHGRIYVQNHSNGEKKNSHLAELVAEYFIPGYNKELHNIEFIDGNPLNCAAENLRLVPKKKPAPPAERKPAKGESCDSKKKPLPQGSVSITCDTTPLWFVVAGIFTLAAIAIGLFLKLV